MPEILNGRNLSTMAEILIVDDDPNNVRVLQYTLRKAGYNVQSAPNGQRGLEMLNQSHFQLLILDLSMPVMDGLSLLTCLRADAQYSSLPVIVLTASGDDHDLVAVSQLGVHIFLTKPSSSFTLLEQVAKALEPA